MNDFPYRDGQLLCDDFPLCDIADRFGTPVFVYSRRALIDHYNELAAAFAPISPAICYAVKSCSNLHICRLMGEQGSWFDVVSVGELRRVIEAGALASHIVFAGVGKTDSEIREAVAAGVAWLNVESEPELENLIDIAAQAGKIARVALRANPDVDPHTHIYTTTGKKENKFGMDFQRVRSVFSKYASAKSVELSGIHLHIGSPVNQVDPYVRAIGKTLDLIEGLRGEGFEIQALNIGGGFGMHYPGSEAPPLADYGARIVPLFKDRGLDVLLEPGRCIAGPAGVLLTRTVYLKQAGDRNFLIVDAAMTELIRPALYGAHHFIWPVVPHDGMIPPSWSPELDLPGSTTMDVVGGVCESGDFLAKGRRLPPIKRGDLIAIFTAGAYGFSMSSQYNSRPRPPEVLVSGDQVKLIRRRETYDDLVEPERV